MLAALPANDLQYKRIAACALQALLEEAMLYPKPGLVDPVCSGSHEDMDISSFLKSIASFPQGFTEYVRIGFSLKGAEKVIIREALQKEGLKLENTMYLATGGVNTHKGAIFLFGYLLAAVGYLLPKVDSIDAILQTAAWLAEGLCASHFKTLDESSSTQEHYTHGERMYKKYGVKGIRGEVEAGLPLTKAAYAYYTGLKEMGTPDRSLYTLLYIMAGNEDTTVLYRGGKEALKGLQDTSADILKRSLTGGALYEALEHFNTECIERNVSPGGSADLLAAVFFLDALNKMIHCK